MEKHFELTDEEFESQFFNCELNPEIFSHEAHLRLAWIYIEKYGIEQAIEMIQIRLEEYVDFLGAKDKYNITLTVAATKAVYHYWLKSISTDFKHFIQEFPQLKFNFKELMNHHYGFDIYDSPKAKKSFLNPDLLPFDKIV